METKKHEHFPIPVTQSVLSNGLTVFTIETGTAGAHAELHFNAGAVDDGKYPGRAHFLEHIKYEGPATDGVHPALRDLYRNGVRGNASTSFHYTSYELGGLTEYVPAMIRALCSIGFDETIESKYVDLERRVILREIQTHDIRDQRRSWFIRTLYPQDTLYHNPVCGTERSVEEMTALELYEFQERLYTPTNAALFVASGKTHAEVVELASKIVLPNRKLDRAPLKPYSDPRLLRATFEEFNANDGIEVYFRGSEKAEDETRLGITLDVLCAFPIGLLSQRLRMQDRRIYSLSSGVSREGRSASIETAVHPQHFNPVEQAVFEEIERLVRMDYPQEVFDTVLQQRRAFFLTRFEMRGNARWVGHISGNWHEDNFSDPKEMVLSTTREHLAELARTYLDRQHYGCIHTFRKNRG